MKKIIIAIVLSFIFYTQSFACSCLQPESPTKELEKTDLVFIWKVNNIETKKANNEIVWEVQTNFVDFEVNSVIKWDKSSNITVRTPESSATCGYNFTENDDYIVYAYNYKEEGDHGVSLCSRTALLENATDDIEELASEIESWKITKSDNNENNSEDYKKPVDTGINNDNNMILYSALILFLLIGFVIFFTKRRESK